MGDTELGRRPVLVKVFGLHSQYQVSSRVFERERDGSGTYEAEVGQDESLIEVGERAVDVRKRLGSPQWRRRPRRNPRRSSHVFEADAVAVLDDRDDTPETLARVDGLVEVTDQHTLARAHVARVVVDCKAIDAHVDALHGGGGLSCCVGSLANLQVREDGDALMEWSAWWSCPPTSHVPLHDAQ